MSQTYWPHLQAVFLSIALACASVPALRSQSIPPRHASVDLISEESAIRPGESISLGLNFQIDGGWHIYWVNPGDSGQPPVVLWHLPPGWQASAILWPVPQRIPDHSLIDYGYENDALLIVPVRAPTNLTAGQTAALRATVEWLVCREVCIPAQANVNLPLPVRKGRGVTYSRWRELFQKTRAQLPQPAPRGWKTTAGSQGNHFVLQIETGHSESARTFLPLAPNQVDNAVAPVITPFKNGVRVMLMKSDELLKPISHLNGVVVTTSGRGYVIDAPVISTSLNHGR